MSDDNHEAPSQLIQLAGQASLTVMGSATVSVRSNFALHHMYAAVKAARRAHEVEVANCGRAHGPWFDDMLHVVPVAIIMGSAALEAQVNEAVQDILDGYQAAQASNSQKVLLKELKDSTASNTLDKCRNVALLLGKIPDRGRREWEEASLLLTLRNRFIHFKPAWDHEEVHDSKWVRALKQRIPVYAPYAEAFQFPYGFITYGAAKWAVTTALDFARHAAALLGVLNRFEGQNYALP